MLLALGDHTFDVSHRAVVMGVVPSGVDVFGGRATIDELLRSADGLVGAGADVLDLGVVGGGLDVEVAGLDASGALTRPAFDLAVAAVEAVATRFDVPVAVTVGEGSAPGSVDLADLAGAGADLVEGSSDLAGVAALGLSVVLRSSDDLPAAEAAGLGRERLVVAAGLGGAASPTEQAELLRGVDRLVARGCAVLLDLPPELPAVAAWSLGLARGCRVLRTADVRTARRTADVLASILSVRSEVHE